jgi:hypothetical protein
MIHEGVITTVDPDGSGHVAPMGFMRDGVEVSIAPFAPSRTLDNLARQGAGTLSFCDDVRIIAGALTGRRDWPLEAASAVTGWRLAAALAHCEFVVERQAGELARPRFVCRIVHEANHAPYAGFNRAQGAVIEAAILVSRLDFIAPEKIASEMAYLKIALEKTAGPRERVAWEWLVAAIEAHPRHGALAL